MSDHRVSGSAPSGSAASSASSASGPGTSAFDDAAIERLKRAAEEVAWLTGRGYPLEIASELVAKHHALEPAHRAAIACGTCSEPQYRRRAARELEADDIAKRPLAIDAIDAVAAIEAALAGRPVLQTLDGSIRAFDVARDAYVAGNGCQDAVDRLLLAAKPLRPSVVKLVIDASAPGAARLGEVVAERAKAHKLKIEIAAVASATKALRKERQIVTSDAETLDACAGWFNLVAPIASAIPSARIVRLQ